MLGELKLVLDKNVNINQLSNLQGVLMKNISTEYAEFLHNQRFNPYSIGICKEDGSCIWTINTVTSEAYDNIIVPLLEDDFNRFEICKSNNKINILEKEVKKVKIRDKINTICNGKLYSNYVIRFVTPVAFKSEGKYICLPDLRLIYQNLFNKFNYIVNGLQVYDNNTIDRLVNCTEIKKFDIESYNFHLEKISIPGCTGNICIRAKGTEDELKLINILLTFGEYCGLGIKSSIGMGKIKIERG